jgi:tripartite-type tricarboxylate transporter receptor subunit TctC
MMRFLTTGLVAATLAFTASAQSGKPIEWVVGYAAGGGSDAVARATAEAMAKTLGAPVLINNKPGAATNIAAEYAVRAKDLENTLFTADFAGALSARAGGRPAGAGQQLEGIRGLGQGAERRRQLRLGRCRQPAPSGHRAAR